ncbi:MAG: HEPN domain-containing protein [Ammonifex sp.]|nr:MAG: HEPN domain-containing protein [Ammonifex sp.]
MIVIKPAGAPARCLANTLWGHSIVDLLRCLLSQVRVSVGDELLDCAKTLDKYYIPARYPNGFQSGSPYEYFTRRDAQDALFCSRTVVEFCESLLARSR